MFRSITPTAAEIVARLPGDSLLAQPDIIMDRAFSLPGTPEAVWPWFMQLGKHRAGWYLPKWIEFFILPKKRALRSLNPELQNLKQGDVIDDWGGRSATFTLQTVDPPHKLVYTSTRGHTFLTWTISMKRESSVSTRVQLRLRLAPVKYPQLAKTLGGLIDKLTVAGLAAGLTERLKSN